MAGSLNHIVDDDGRFTMDTIDHVRDAAEALDECFQIIHLMTGGDKTRVNAACEALGFPEIEHDMVISD